MPMINLEKDHWKYTILALPWASNFSKPHEFRTCQQHLMRIVVVANNSRNFTAIADGYMLLVSTLLLNKEVATGNQNFLFYFDKEQSQIILSRCIL